MKTAFLATLVAAVLMSGCAPREVASTHDGFSFVTIGDSRSHKPCFQPQGYLDNIQQINRLRPKPLFVVNVGDVIHGPTKTSEVNEKEWDTYEAATSKLAGPVHIAVGNHDVWNQKSKDIYNRRYRETYYSFDQGKSHFIILSTEELETKSSIRGEQFEWFKKDLEANMGADHIFIFMHKPLWSTHRNLERSKWKETSHPLLAKHRSVTVYAGHDHYYENYGKVDGVQYYVTGGGGVNVRSPRPYGGFHHFMVTTVIGKTVSSVLVGSDGTLQGDSVSPHWRLDAYRKVGSSLTCPSFDIPKKGNKISLKLPASNPLEEPLQIQYEWETEGTSWTVTPAKGEFTLAAKENRQLKVTATFDRENFFPLPVAVVKSILNGDTLKTLNKPLRPSVSKAGVAVRLAKKPVTDGVISPNEYGKALACGKFVDYAGRGYPRQKTSFVMGYDNTALYIAVTLLEDSPATIEAEDRPRDGAVWKDDDIDLFVDATFDRKTYHQLAVNLKNVQRDVIGGPDHSAYGDGTWNANWKTAVKIGRKSVVVEYAIPFKELGVKAPKPGQKWGMNVCRVRNAVTEEHPKKELSAWSIPYGNFHDPSRFGTITFE